MGRNVSVERGAALLDERLPGWDDEIVLEELDISSNCRCVLGQLHGGRNTRRSLHWRSLAFERGLGRLDLTYADATRNGFLPRGSFNNLTKAWLRLIERRRKS